MVHNRKDFVVSKKREDIVIDVGVFSLLDYLPKDMLILIGFFIQDKKDKATYAITCKTINNFFQPDLDKFGLYQSVIDDDREAVQRILSRKPELLIVEPKNLIIESQLTWQKFFIEKATVAVMAAKRKQIKMLELLLPYYDKLEQTDEVRKAKAEALSAWKIYETKKNTEGEDEIVIPSEYADYAKSLVYVFSEETFPNGSDKYGYGMLSEKTELTLSTLFNRLLPDEAVKLDDYLDVELLLLAIYKAYWDHFNWEQRDAFCIRVRGLIQSVLTPETAKIFCESLDHMVTAMKNGEKKDLSKAAVSHKLKSGEPFYRESRDSKEGAGYNFYCGIFGRGMARAGAAGGDAWGPGLPRWLPGWRVGGLLVGGGRGVVPRFVTWIYLCQAKTTDLQNLCSDPKIKNRAHV